MMKKILGKIFLGLVFFSVFLHAEVELKVDKSSFYKGEPVNITIEASGEDVKFPQIDSIAGYQVVSVSNGSSTTILNQKVTHKVSRTYTIVPEDSFTIPPFKVIVDNKEEFTPKKEIKLKKPTASKSDAEFVFMIKADKTHLKVGESTILRLIFKKRLDAKADKIVIDEFKNTNFWIKKIGDFEKYQDGDYEVYVYKYQITPQKAGRFIIDPLKVTIGVAVSQNIGGFNDPFFDQFFQTMNYKRIYSNSLEIVVDPLPGDVEIFGEYEIFANVDKKRVEANKPVNLTIKILGEGNIEDIKKFDINIPSAVVYADEPKIKTYIKDGKNYGEFVQKVAIISDKSYEIPPIEFKYFDKNLNKVVTKKTKPIKIEVISVSTAPKKEPKVEVAAPIKKDINNTKVLQKSENGFLKYLFFVVGVIVGFLGGYFLKNLKSKPKKELPLEKKIKKAKNDKELYKVLLPYAQDPKIKPFLQQLEENIYHNKKNKIDKEEILEAFFDDIEQI